MEIKKLLKASGYSGIELEKLTKEVEKIVLASLYASGYNPTYDLIKLIGIKKDGS